MAQIATITVETAGGPVDLPVYEPGDSGSNRLEAFRVQTASGPGFVPLAAVDEADRPYLRVQTSSGVRAVDTSASGIPDSVVHQYLKDGFTTDNWPDSVGNEDITTISGPSFDSSAFANTGGVVGDGVDDFAQDGTLGDFGSDLGTDFAISIPFNTTEGFTFMLGCRNPNSGTGLFVGFEGFGTGSAGEVSVLLSGENDSSWQENTSNTFNDGVDHHLIVNKVGNLAGDIKIFVDDMTTPEPTTTPFYNSFSGSTKNNFTVPMTYFARNSADFGMSEHFEGALGTLRWFNDSLSEQERKGVNNSLAWR